MLCNKDPLALRHGVYLTSIFPKYLYLYLCLFLIIFLLVTKSPHCPWSNGGMKMLCDLKTNSFILSETLLRGSQVPLDLHGSRWKSGHSLRDFKVNYFYHSWSTSLEKLFMFLGLVLSYKWCFNATATFQTVQLSKDDRGLFSGKSRSPVTIMETPGNAFVAGTVLCLPWILFVNRLKMLKIQWNPSWWRDVRYLFS